MFRRVLPIVVMGMITLTGCGGGSDSSTTPEIPQSSTSSSTPADTPSTTPEETTTTTPSTRVTDVVNSDDVLDADTDPKPDRSPKGANAAPGSPNPMYDASGAAEANFIAWFAYETYDQAQDFPNKDRAAVYADGVSACTQLRTGKDPSLVMNDAQQIKGYSRTGAAALYKAAINSLCPWHNQGFQTGFDTGVIRVQQFIDQRITWTPAPPPFYDYGNFAKDTCMYLRLYGTNGLEEHLRGLQGVYTEGNMMVYVNGDPQHMKVLVKGAVMGLCDASLTSLGPFWMDVQ